MRTIDCRGFWQDAPAIVSFKGPAFRALSVSAGWFHVSRQIDSLMAF
jgi:hypothetical protein